MIKTLEANLKGRDFVIGDLHGCYELFEKLLDGLQFDKAVDRIISVGDLIDRGPDSLKCLALLREPWFHSVKSNHEQMMIDAFTDQPLGIYWVPNGGKWGLETLVYQDKVENNQDVEVKPTPDDVELLSLLPLVEELPFLITVKKKDGSRLHVIHAELPPSESPITDEDLESEYAVKLLSMVETAEGSFFTWGRHKFYRFCRLALNNKDKLIRCVKTDLLNKQKRIAHHPALSHIISGHTVMHQPLTVLGQTVIDTGAFECYERNPPNWAGLTALDINAWKFYQATPSEFREAEEVSINTSDVI